MVLYSVGNDAPRFSFGNVNVLGKHKAYPHRLERWWVQECWEDVPGSGQVAYILFRKRQTAVSTCGRHGHAI